MVPSYGATTIHTGDLAIICGAVRRVVHANQASSTLRTEHGGTGRVPCTRSATAWSASAFPIRTPSARCRRRDARSRARRRRLLPGTSVHRATRRTARGHHRHRRISSGPSDDPRTVRPAGDGCHARPSHLRAGSAAPSVAFGEGKTRDGAGHLTARVHELKDHRSLDSVMASRQLNRRQPWPATVFAAASQRSRFPVRLGNEWPHLEDSGSEMSTATDTCCSTAMDLGLRSRLPGRLAVTSVADRLTHKLDVGSRRLTCCVDVAAGPLEPYGASGKISDPSPRGRGRDRLWRGSRCWRAPQQLCGGGGRGRRRSCNRRSGRCAR